ncbi:9566_t:CDS:2, partial [Scutellospora calospora]
QIRVAKNILKASTFKKTTMVHKIKLSNNDNFDESIDKIVKEHEGQKIYVLFFGQWCPDCINADPLINKYIEMETDCVFVEASVGTKYE